MVSIIELSENMKYFVDCTFHVKILKQVSCKVFKVVVAKVRLLVRSSYVAF